MTCIHPRVHDTDDNPRESADRLGRIDPQKSPRLHETLGRSGREERAHKEKPGRESAAADKEPREDVGPHFYE